MTTLAGGLGPGARAGARALAAAWWHRPALVGILGLSAGLNLWRLDRNGWGNEYYSGAVHSMLESWRNFVFVAFDPGGLVAVDKTPLALWVQAASARLFGYSEAAILIPEALMGVASVGVLYLLVSRPWGRVAGLTAALALAVSPVSVAVSRDNNPDALFVLLLLLAVLAGVRAAESGRLTPLLASAALVGLAFNTKMLLAAVVLPGIALGVLLTSRHGWGRRLAHLGAAAATLVAVSGAWVAAVALTPESARPWVGSTGDDSILGLALGYNGVGRVAGQTGGTSFGGTGGLGLGGALSGEPGLFRLLNDALADQIGWLLPLAVAGGVSLLLGTLRARRRSEVAWMWAVGGWFVVTAGVLSAAGGIVHTYYAALLAPPLCALVGAGAVSAWRDVQRGGSWPLLPLAGLAVTTIVQLTILGRTSYLPALKPALAILALAGGAALVVAARRPGRDRGGPRLAAAGLCTALVALLLAPAAWSLSTSRGAVDGVFPGAGPAFVSGLSGDARGGPSGGSGTGDAASALAWAERNDPGSVWSLVVTSEQEAAPLVIAGGRVAAMGGFTGRETVLSPSLVARLVASGQARHFLIGATRSLSGTVNPTVALVSSTCAVVPAASWGGGGPVGLGAGGGGGATLYDCAGRAGALSASLG